MAATTAYALWLTASGGRGAEGHGVQGQICDILRPQLAMNSYESLPAPLATQIPTLCIHTSGGRGRRGALILDRCLAFDLFASVDAHLC
jgi:hypothetical protein